MTDNEIEKLYEIWLARLSEPYAQSFFIYGKLISAYDLVEELRRRSPLSLRWMENTRKHFAGKEVDLESFLKSAVSAVN